MYSFTTDAHLGCLKFRFITVCKHSCTCLFMDLYTLFQWSMCLEGIVFSPTHYLINSFSIWLHQYTLWTAVQRSSRCSTFLQTLGIVFFIFAILVGGSGTALYIFLICVCWLAIWTSFVKCLFQVFCSFKQILFFIFFKVILLFLN